MLTYEQAKERLKKLAAGRYHTAQISMSQSETIECYTEYMLYIAISPANSVIAFSKLSWEDALTSIKQKLGA
jgi:hypothetical protein